MAANACFPGNPRLGILQQQLRVRTQAVDAALVDLSSIERMIQDLMQKREEKLCVIDELRSKVELTEQLISDCVRESEDRLLQIRNRHNVKELSFTLFAILPPEVYVHILKYLSPKDLCKSCMLTSKNFGAMSRRDDIWCHVFARVYGAIDDPTCRLCKHLLGKAKGKLLIRQPRDARTTFTALDRGPLVVAAKGEKGDGDLHMADIASALSLDEDHQHRESSDEDFSWLAGFKHRKEMEGRWSSSQCGVCTLYGHSDWVTSFVVIGETLISASYDATIKFWDLVKKECTATLTGHTAGINALDHSGEYLVSASLDCSIRVWNIDTKVCTAVLEGHTDQVSHVQFITARGSTSPKPTVVLVSASLDGTLRVWDCSGPGKCLRVLQGHASGVMSIAVCYQYAASGSVDGEVAVWDCLSGRRIFTLSGHSDRVSGLQFDFNSSRLVSASWDFTARVWDLKTGTCVHVLQGHVFRIRCVKMFGSNTLLTGSWDYDIKLWDLKTGACVRTLSGHSNYVWGCELQMDVGRALTCSWDKTVRVWDIRSGRLVATLDHLAEVLCLHANSHRIIGGSKEIRIWNFSS